MNRGLRKYGLAWVEAVFVVGIVGIGLAFLLPGLQAGREAARRRACSNNFKNIGLAIHDYHSTHKMMPMHGTGPANELNDDCCGSAIRPGHGMIAVASARHQLSFLVGILPFANQQELWNKISIGHTDKRGARWPAFGPAPYTAIYDPWNSEIPLYRCPSDPGEGWPALGRTNYAACVGDSAFRTDDESWSYFKGSSWRYGGSNAFRARQVKASVRGAFVPRRVMKFRDVLDGLANTIMAGEIATDLGDRDFRTVGSQGNGRNNVLENPKFCADSEQIDEEKPTFWASGENDRAPNLTVDATSRGARWADFRPLYTQVNTILPPNAEVCLQGSHRQDGIVPPSSRHPGGAHILMGDGAVIFITDSIEAGDQRAPVVYYRNSQNLCCVGEVSPYGLWGALGTRASKEVLEEELY